MIALVGFITLTASMQASDDVPKVPSRGEYWKYLREKKASEPLQAEPAGKVERGLLQLKERRILEKFQAGVYGFHPLLGGLATGAGFAFGTEYRHSFADSRIETSARVQGSMRGYKRFEANVGSHHLAGGRLSLAFNARQSYSPQEDFFGIGKDSSASNRTNYTYNSTDLQASAAFRPARWIEAGTLAGTLQTRIKAGTDPRSPSSETVFNESDVPGLLSHPDYTYAGVFVRSDTRDEPGNAREGHKVQADWTTYRDRKSSGYSFNRFDAEAQQYIPFFNKRRVIALRARTAFSQTDDGNTVPFFLQPTLGGSEDLRGFREFRFRDRNMMVMNAEYRWEAFSGLDLALFTDAGKVFSSSREFNFQDLEKSYGIGFRFNTAKSVFLRIDTAYGNEGTRLFVKFGHVF
jgi:outer membrane protein assembly factor BamA